MTRDGCPGDSARGTSNTPARRAASATLCIAFIGAAVASPPASVAVTDLLRALGSTGVDVLYTSDLVPPGLQAPMALHGADPLSRAAEGLAAHRLRLRSVGHRRYLVVRDLSLAAPAALFPPAAALAPPPDVIQEVTVFASRYAFGVTAPGAASSLTRSDIEQVPGAQTDPIRALRETPGLSTNLSSRPYVRGAFLEDVLVQFDGVPLADPFHFKNFQNLVSAFDPSAIDRVDVYTGGFPVKYGTRSAGVIDLAPRSVESGYEQRIAASLFSYDMSTVGRAERWPVEWLATVRHSASEVVHRPLDADIGEPTFYDALGRLRWQTSPVSAWTLGWLMLDDRLRLASDPAEEQAQAHFRDLYTWLTWDRALTGAVHSHSSLSMASAERSRSGTLTLAGIADGRLDERRDFSSLDLRTGWTYVPSAAVTWDLGAEVGLERAELRFARQEHFPGVMAASFNRPTDATIASMSGPRSSSLALFASVRRQWRSVETELGARLDRADYRGLGAHAQLSPRFNVRYDASPDWHLYASWGEFTQAQRVSEWRTEEGQAIPDAATRAVHLIAGVAHEGASTAQWRLEVYRNHWSALSPYFDTSLDALSLLPELEPDRVRVTPRDAEAAGVELSARLTFDSGVQVWSAYAVSRTTDDVNDHDVPRSWDQTHAANAGLAWQGRQTAASVLVEWHTGWPRTPLAVSTGTPAFPGGLIVGDRNSARWGSYFSADLRVSRTVPVTVGELSFWLNATNVTNRANECCVGFSPAGTTAGVTVTRPKTWLPQVVNVGFSWRIRAVR
jgi:outer membrane receptor protein involved in Fe transport